MRATPIRQHGPRAQNHRARAGAHDDAAVGQQVEHELADGGGLQGAQQPARGATGEHQQPGGGQHLECCGAVLAYVGRSHRVGGPDKPVVRDPVVVRRAVLPAGRPGQGRDDHGPGGPAYELGVHVAAAGGELPPALQAHDASHDQRR